MIQVRFTNGDFQQFPTGRGWSVEPSTGTVVVYGTTESPGLPAEVVVELIRQKPDRETYPIATMPLQHVNSIAFVADPEPVPTAEKPQA